MHPSPSGLPKRRNVFSGAVPVHFQNVLCCLGCSPFACWSGSDKKVETLFPFQESSLLLEIPLERGDICAESCAHVVQVLRILKGVIRAKRKPPFFMPTRYVNPPKCRGFEGARVLNKVSKSLPTVNPSSVYPYRGRIFYDLPQNRVGGGGCSQANSGRKPTKKRLPLLRRCRENDV